MTKINITTQIRRGAIKTNYLRFPKRINGFVRNRVQVPDTATDSTFNYASYTRGNDLGFVTLADLENGLRQVRKVDLVRTDAGFKVAVPSDRIW